MKYHAPSSLTHDAASCLKHPAASVLVRCLIILCLAGLCLPTGHCTTASEIEMERVCSHWLQWYVQTNGHWATSTEPIITESIPIEMDGLLLGRSFSIAPEGYIAVPILKELPPVIACSESNGMNPNESGGSPLLLKELLLNRITRFISVYGTIEAAQPANGPGLFDAVHLHQWELYTDPDFPARLNRGDGGDITQVGPLLSTRWHQDAPYNNLCPAGDGGRCVVGCVATAASQILAHHRITGSGSGSHSYYWSGDTSCGSATGGATLSATFSDGYDWANMPDTCTNQSPAAARNAVAELCYEVGVALDMDYGFCGSGANTYATASVLPAYFGLAGTASVRYRNDYTAQSWFNLLKTDLNKGCPTIYRFSMSQGGHAVVCDGWRDTGGINQYHINYGWQNTSYNDWYSVDQINGSVDWTQEAAVVGLSPGSAPVTLAVDISMPSPFFQAGDACSCTTVVTNSSGTSVSGYPLFVLLDISGTYFFAPSFTGFSYYDRTFQPGNTTIPVLPSFAWPSGSGAFSNAYWYAAVTNPYMTFLASNLDSFAFGWNGGGGGSWTTIKSETFEGDWPNAWRIYVDNGYADCYWSDVSCFQKTGNWACWCAGAGSQAPAECSSYVNNMSTLMTYGPFSLAGASDAEMVFQCYLGVEACSTACDYLGCYASVNGQNYYGYNFNTSGSDWRQSTLDLTNVYTLGNLCGQPQVWVGFYFKSDSGVTHYGAYLDDIIIRKK
ncbi:C10 family peptidase [bacterium]|nr:C10 family peptidase [candidate division CSSED10-310 bacterium]